MILHFNSAGEVLGDFSELRESAAGFQIATDAIVHGTDGDHWGDGVENPFA